MLTADDPTTAGMPAEARAVELEKALLRIVSARPAFDYVDTSCGPGASRPGSPYDRGKAEGYRLLQNIAREALDMPVVMGHSATIEAWSAQKRRHVEEQNAIILRAIAACGGNQTKAAELLGMNRTVMGRRIKEHGLEVS